MRPEYHESYFDYRWGGAQKARQARDQRARYLKRAGFNVIRSSVGYRVFGSRKAGLNLLFARQSHRDANQGSLP